MKMGDVEVEMTMAKSDGGRGVARDSTIQPVSSASGSSRQPKSPGTAYVLLR